MEFMHGISSITPRKMLGGNHGEISDATTTGISSGSHKKITVLREESRVADLLKEFTVDLQGKFVVELLQGFPEEHIEKLF